jgi:hypothetical protein
MLRLLPVANPEQLVMIWSTGPHLGSNRGMRAASYPMYQDFQQKAQAFSYMFCRFQTPTSVSFDGRTERVTAEMVSGNYFQALGVKPMIGRVFSPEEDDRRSQAIGRRMALGASQGKVIWMVMREAQVGWQGAVQAEVQSQSWSTRDPMR